jgi:hypothetical protein
METVKTITSVTARAAAGAAAKSKAEHREKLSKAGAWRKAHPEGIITVNDPAVLYGLSVYEILN